MWNWLKNTTWGVFLCWFIHVCYKKNHRRGQIAQERVPPPPLHHNFSVLHLGLILIPSLPLQQQWKLPLVPQRLEVKYLTSPVKASTLLLSCVSSRSPPWSFTGTRTLSWERRLSGTSATCPITGWWWWGARDTRVTWTTPTPGTELSPTSCTRCESGTTKSRRAIVTPDSRLLHSDDLRLCD